MLVQSAVDPSGWRLGGTLQWIVLPKEARPGPVRIVLALGEAEKDVVGETTIHVGPITPDKVEVDFPDATVTWTARADNGRLEVDGPVVARYLFAAKSDKLGAARDLRLEATARVSAGETPREACYADFAFGRHDEKPITGGL